VDITTEKLTKTVSQQKYTATKTHMAPKNQKNAAENSLESVSRQGYKWWKFCFFFIWVRRLLCTLEEKCPSTTTGTFGHC
jgi:hypothetical protein